MGYEDGGGGGANMAATAPFIHSEEESLILISFDSGSSLEQRLPKSRPFPDSASLHALVCLVP